MEVNLVSNNSFLNSALFKLSAVFMQERYLRWFCFHLRCPSGDGIQFNKYSTVCFSGPGRNHHRCKNVSKKSADLSLAPQINKRCCICCRYKEDVSSEQKDALMELCRSQVHDQVNRMCFLFFDLLRLFSAF